MDTTLTKPDGRPLRLAGRQEAATVLGLSRASTYAALNRPEAPAPLTILGATPVWDVDDLEAYARTRKKTRGPAPRATTAGVSTGA